MVLAGGAGTRFWPASRRTRPKPFVDLIGETPFDATLARLGEVAPRERTWVVAATELRAAARAALRPHRGVRLVLEPTARNTAAAIALAAATVHGRDPDALVGVFPADHHIPAPAAFHRAVRAAARAARADDALVLIGIQPRHADTGYGYLKLGASGPGSSLRVARFVEKPNAARARRFVKSGQYLWNAGMVVASARRILSACEQHAPEVWKPLGRVLGDLARGRRVTRVTLDRAYRRVRPISFDHAVLERTRGVLAIRGRFRWSDLGSWDAIGDHLPVRGGNRVGGRGPVVALDARDNVIWNPTGRALALIGLEGYVIVNTEDAVLVCAKERAQDVRQIVEELEGRQRGDLT